jgi:hypothetical protein
VQFQQKSSGGLFIFIKKSVRDIFFKFLGPPASSAEVMHYIRVRNFFLTIWSLWVSKDAEFYVDFKNTNLSFKGFKKNS